MKNLRLIFLLLLFINIAFGSSEKKQFLIMIDPAGHAKNVGRKLVEGYERAQTFKFAQGLQKGLQDKYGFRVIITRYPGEEIVDLQNASFANRLNVDFYINLNIYRQDSVKPKIFMYHLVYNSMVDLARRTFEPYAFMPINQAHFANIHTTRSYAEYTKKSMIQPHYQRWFDFYGLYGVPFKPLAGIAAPAIAIEVGICQEDKWQIFIDPLVESLNFLVNI